MSIAVDQLLQITVLGKASNQAVLNVFHYRPRELLSWVPQEILSFTALWFSFWRNNILPRLSNTYAVQAYDFRVIGTSIANPTPPPPAKINYVDALVIAGGAMDVGIKIGDPLPTLNAVSWRLVSTLPTRHGRGGKRFGPIIEDDTIGNSLTGAAFTPWQTAAGPYLLGLGPNEFLFNLDPVVFARTTYVAAVGNLPRAHSAVVTSVITNSFVSSQVSRKERATIGG